MKSTNYHYYHADRNVLQTLLEEYVSIGRDAAIDGNKLTVFARTRKRKSAPKQERNKRS